jgi:sarcosine oxidase subunit delta
MNQCVAGVQKEWWFHKDGCGSWFTIYRDTTTNLEKEAGKANHQEADKS